jgi:hypothetical protein
MRKWISFSFLLLPTVLWAAEPKTETFTIPSGQTPPSLDGQDRTPFFAESSTGNELMEEISSLKEQVADLKSRVADLEKIVQKK